MKTFLSLHSYTLLTSGLSYCSTLTNTAFTLSYCCTLTCSADLWPRHTLITQPEAGAEVRVSAGVDSDCGICATAVEVCSRVWWVAHPAQTCTTIGVTCNTGMLTAVSCQCHELLLNTTQMGAGQESRVCASCCTNIFHMLYEYTLWQLEMKPAVEHFTVVW